MRRRKKCLGTRLLLLAAVEGVQADAGHLNNLESDSGEITDGMAGTAQTGDQDLVVLLDEVEATIVGHEGDDLLTVLDQLDADALTDSRVRLLGLDSDLVQDDSLGVGGASEGVSLGGGEGVGALPALGGPPVLTADAHKLARGVLSIDLGHG
eukprot:225629_1